MATKVMITVEEFDRLDHEEFRYELDEGELITITKPRPLHNRVQYRILRALILWVEANPIGEVLISENMFVLGPGTRRAPDVSFMLAERASRIRPDEDIQGAPDLAIEIFSPNDTAAAMRRKTTQYFAAGCQEVWLVYPETREVHLWSGPKNAHVVTEEESLTSPVLPGFSVIVRDLF